MQGLRISFWFQTFVAWDSSSARKDRGRAGPSCVITESHCERPGDRGSHGETVMPWKDSASRKASLENHQYWDPVAPWALQKPFPLRPQFPHLPNTERSVWPGFLLGRKKLITSKHFHVGAGALVREDAMRVAPCQLSWPSRGPWGGQQTLAQEWCNCK